MATNISFGPFRLVRCADAWLLWIGSRKLTFKAKLLKSTELSAKWDEGWRAGYSSGYSSGHLQGYVDCLQGREPPFDCSINRYDDTSLSIFHRPSGLCTGARPSPSSQWLIDRTKESAENAKGETT